MHPTAMNHCGQPFPKLFWVREIVFQSVLCSPTPAPSPYVGCRSRQEACKELLAFHPVLAACFPAKAYTNF